jgi:hypothetical protein
MDSEMEDYHMDDEYDIGIVDTRQELAETQADLAEAVTIIREMHEWNNNVSLLYQTEHTKRLKACIETSRAKADADELRWRLEDAEEKIRLLEEVESNLTYWAAVDGVSEQILQMQTTAPPPSGKA